MAEVKKLRMVGVGVGHNIPNLDCRKKAADTEERPHDTFSQDTQDLYGGAEARGCL